MELFLVLREKPPLAKRHLQHLHHARVVLEDLGDRRADYELSRSAGNLLGRLVEDRNGKVKVHADDPFSEVFDYVFV
ncbi:MAG: hypothetical protein A2W38_02595 [Deltaproteobacteria bacterium RBG_19FT_COMBO_58_16]|nr:MAG: hypothetical protein A2W38_02595 [Deltaproteobacteria bacterium RBG_19FT_COMBO_58_16]